MDIIGVLDLRAGKAVHARGGVRANYLPIREVAGRAVPEGDAISVARRYMEMGVRQIYVADLDAITGGPLQRKAIQQLIACGVPTWLDAGTGSIDGARDVAALGISRLIVGLETLASFTVFDEICQTVDRDVALSLDLRHGHPLGAAAAAGGTPEDLAMRAAAAGAATIIVLDLARVGSGAGLDLPLLERIRRAVPHVTLAAGGGVRDASDLTRLADAGCDAALVGTALLAGRITGTLNREP